MPTRFAVVIALTFTTLSFAEDWEESRSDERKKANAESLAHDLKKAEEECTFGGKRSAECFELRKKILTARSDGSYFNDDSPLNTDLTKALDACFIEALMNERNGSKNASLDATAMLEAGIPEDATMKECFRVMDEQTGTQWREKAKRGIFYRTLRGKVETDFSKKCGVVARATSALVQIVLLDKPKKGGTFFTGKDPEGKTVTISCNGRVAFTYPSGSTSVSEPRMEAEVAKDLDNVNCLQSCARKALACQPSHNIFLPECRAACLPQCGG